MADFNQNGIITTFHDLKQRDLSSMESELVSFSRSRPIGLILPSLYSELEGPALRNIVQQLKHVPYLSQIIIGLDRANESQFQHARDFFSELPQPHRILWNDGPKLKAVDERLRSMGVAPTEAGKGRNVWYCMGYVQATAQVDTVALHDCDILTYDRSLLAKLVYPIANPMFNYEFCKGFYSRVADNKMNGRVARLLVTPLIKSLKRTLGEMDYLDYMDSFRYPTAGEMAFRRNVLSELRLPSDWGIEVGVLSEMYRNYSCNRLCQVDVADIYDHKHQSLSLTDETGGLSKMSIDIIKALFRKLAIHGVIFSGEAFRTLKATYYRTALDFIESYHADAVMNGLNLDVHTEERAVEMFAQNIMKAGQYFLDNPMQTPFIPTWNRVNSAMPEIYECLIEAVESDNTGQ